MKKLFKLRYFMILCTFGGILIIGSLKHKTESHTNLFDKFVHIEKPSTGSSFQALFPTFKTFIENQKQIYSLRSSNVPRVCKKLQNLNKTEELRKYLDMGNHLPEKRLIYIPKRKFAACFIHKVGSTSGTRNAMLIGGRKSVGFKNYVEVYKKFPVPKHFKASVHLDGFTVMTIIRHPLSRLVSCYFSKIIGFHSLEAKVWNKVNLFITKNMRGGKPNFNVFQNNSELKSVYDLKKNYSYASPDEFLRYVVQKPFGNTHWLPMVAFCPFCEVNFNMISDVETLEEDTKYLEQVLNLSLKEQIKKLERTNSTVIDKNLDEKLKGFVANPSKGSPSLREHWFWEHVTTDTLKRIIHIYKYDLEMFNYSVHDYFKKLNMDWLNGKEKGSLRMRKLVGLNLRT